MYSKPLFVPSSSKGSIFERGRMPKAVSLYEVAPFGLVDDLLIPYLNNPEIILRVTDSPSSLVVR